MSKRYTLDVQENAEGELFIEFPPELMAETGWKEGDEVEIGVDDAGKLYLKKANT